MNAVGIIFSNIHDENLPEMTRQRTMASVPFGCRYRLIDFPLSNMVNAEINKIGVITHYNYQSLMDHIGTGKDWDLSRRGGGIHILPPFITAYDQTVNGLYSTRLEALIGILNFITKCREEYVVLSDCDAICNLDFAQIVHEHIENNSDITIVVKNYPLSRTDVGKQQIITADENGRVTDISEHTSNMTGNRLVSINIMVMRRVYLQGIILDSIAHGYKDLFRDILRRNMSAQNYRIHLHTGYHASINSIADYYRCSMQLLDKDVREELFLVEHRAIYTKVKNSAPTNYRTAAKIKNSLIADGCVIEGTVENSILFRGVKVGRGTVVKNSILMQDTYTGANVYLNCVITDKNVVICDERCLSGYETMPFYIDKGSMV